MAKNKKRFKGSSKGGKTTFSRYGSEHFRNAALKAHEVIKKRDPNFYLKLAKAGTAARKKKREEKNNPLSILFGSN